MRRLPLAVLAAVLPFAAPLRGAEEAESGGRLWEGLTGPFRKQAVQEPPGHAKVAGEIRQRRAFPDPFMVPLPGSELVDPKAKGTALLNPAAGRELLEKAAREAEEAAAGIETADLEDLAKRLEATERRLAAAVFSDKTQRVKAVEVAQTLQAVRQRVSIRLDFLRQRIRVTFIIWSPDGKSLAVANQRILREGEELSPGLKVSRIDPNEVTFNYRGEEMAVGLP